MFKRMILIIFMIPSIIVPMDEAHRCIIEESHRYENDDEMKCYFAKKDLFIECCVQAAKTKKNSIQELLAKIKQKIINIDSRDVFVRLLKNIPVESTSDNDKFPPCYMIDVSGIKAHLYIQKISKFPFSVDPGIGYKKPEVQHIPQPSFISIEIEEYDFDLDPSCLVFPLSTQTPNKDEKPAPFTSKLLEDRHPDTVGFELSSENFETEHMMHHKKIIVLFEALIKQYDFIK